MSLYDQLSGGVNNFSPNGNPQMGGAGMGLVPQTGNPLFQSQIDLTVETIVSEVTVESNLPLFVASQNGGEIDTALYPIAAVSQVYYPQSQLQQLSAFGSSLPVILFGKSDFASGMSKGISLNQPTNSNFIGAFCIDQNGFTVSVDSTLLNVQANPTPTIEFHLESVKQGIAKLGDMVLVFATKAINSQTGVAPENHVSSFFVAEVVISCPQVAYATLLDSIASDTFVVDGIRYTVPDVTKIDQFTNAIQTVRQSLFGKLLSDSMNPNSMNMPFNNQTNIVDVPLQLGIDKNIIVNTRINTSCRKFIWSLFIKTTQKIKA